MSDTKVNEVNAWYPWPQPPSMQLMEQPVEPALLNKPEGHVRQVTADAADTAAL
jgi:hypothetical protein